MPPNDLVRLRHMLDAARETVAFAAGKTAQDLKSDRVLSLALVKCIEIIGEAATKVTNETRTTVSADSLGRYRGHEAPPHPRLL